MKIEMITKSLKKIADSRMMLLLLALLCVNGVSAQDDEDPRESFKKARAQMQKDYDDFRKQALAEYSEFVRQAWKKFNAEPAVPAPKEEEILPQLAPGADQETASWFGKQMAKLGNLFKSKNRKVPDVLQPKPEPQAKKKVEEKKPVEMTVQEVIKPEPVTPQPEPLAEVKEETFRQNNYMKFDVFGTECKVRIGENCRFKLKDVSSDAVADVIAEEFPKPQYDNMLYDCLQERKRHDFSDWAYYQMLLVLTRKFYGEGTNEAVLAQAFLYSQSGYKMRLAHDDSHLYMLAATRHFIYNKLFFSLDGDWYFMLDGKQSEQLRICQASFPKESSLSLQISAAQRLAMNPSNERTLTSRKNPDFSFTIHSNKNYIDFLGTYPSSTVNNNFMTRWSMYANCPLDENIREQLYPQMKAKLQGKTELQQVQELLWWMHGNVDLEGVIQDANCFLYRYDEDVWGIDRAFFGEETLFYPYCDCEDRSILLSHFVRDVVGLDVVLVYYPGHLAMAVHFNEPVEGDYVMCDGRKFVIVDPTYIGSRVGETMPMVANEPTTVILLQRS
jgi:hypothetical protein